MAYRINWAILVSVNHQLPERESSKDKADARKVEFGNKPFLSEITFNICISKGKQVHKLGIERLVSLNKKYYKSYKWNHLDIACLIKHSHLHPKRWANVASKHFERRSP